MFLIPGWRVLFAPCRCRPLRLLWRPGAASSSVKCCSRPPMARKHKSGPAGNTSQHKAFNLIPPRELRWCLEGCRCSAPQWLVAAVNAAGVAICCLHLSKHLIFTCISFSQCKAGEHLKVGHREHFFLHAKRHCGDGSSDDIPACSLSKLA